MASGQGAEEMQLTHKLMHTVIGDTTCNCPHCGGLKLAQVSLPGYAGAMESRIVQGYEVPNYRRMSQGSVDGVWCSHCGTMFHPSSV